MIREKRWIKILNKINSDNGEATQESMSKELKMSRGRLSQDLRQMCMWYNGYATYNINKPYKYRLTKLGKEVIDGTKTLSINPRTKSRNIG